jgi:NTE family protein
MPTRAQWLDAEPFTLALSAGFFGFFSHTGLLLALEERGLVPARVVGVSAGSLAGGLWASGLPAARIRDALVGLRRADFWDPGLPVGGLLRGRKFGRKLRDVLAPTGVRRIEECRVPFAAVVHDVFGRRSVALEDGPIDVAIRASCAVPLMFQPLRHEGRILVDGGVSDRAGQTALTDDCARVLLHFLPSHRRVRFGPPVPTPRDLGGRRSEVLVTPDLPKLGPFALDRGLDAVTQTHAYASRWLDDSIA